MRRPPGVQGGGVENELQNSPKPIAVCEPKAVDIEILAIKDGERREPRTL